MKFNLFFLGCCLLLFSDLVYAQDTLKLRDGTIQVAKIIEVSETTIKYKKQDFPSGPTYLLLLSDVKEITYANGTKELITKKPVPISVNQNQDQANTQPTYRPRTTEAQPPPLEVRKPYKKGGPRVGCTYIGEGTASTWITDQGKVPFVSQIGWEAEIRVFTSESGIACVLEGNFLMAGMEQGMFLPSGNILLGLRGREGIEFVLGPNLSPIGLGMEFAIGSTLQMSDVYLPVSLSFIPSVKTAETVVSYTGSKSTVNTKTGFRLTLLIGFYSKKR